ncbi:MAG: AAA family ATPase [Candidatus Dormibacteria bacterium]
MALGSPLHLEARRYAEEGIPIFPCVVNGKEPACEHGFEDATTDLEVIDGWWGEADYNIGLEPERAGWCVIDRDPGGLEAWNNLCMEHGYRRTTMVRTPRGGEHLYYFGSLPPSVGTEKRGLGPHIDTRGRGSYVLVPPSYVIDPVKGIDGGYVWANDEDTAPVPEWIIEACQRSAVAVETPSVIELDLPQNLARADAFLATLGETPDGERNNTAFVVACKVRELGVSPDEVYARMVAWNERCCVPPIEENELALTVGSACVNAQNAPGAFGVTSATEAFGPSLSKLVSGNAEHSSHPRFYVYSEGEQDVMPEPSWIVPDLLPDASTVMWYGETGSYKSFLALDLALGLSYGVETFGFKTEPMQVVYIAGEGPRSVSRRRRPAWKIARETEGKGLFGLMCNMPLARDPTIVAQAIEQIKAQGLKPKLIVIDTAANAMAGMNENDARDATSFIEALNELKNSFDCTVLVVHHTGKDDARGARGSSALKAGVDAAAKITATRATKAVALQIEKMKDAEERSQPWTFEGKVVGPSLVFFPTSLALHSQLTQSVNAYDKKKVGAALIELGAHGRERAVTTGVLATQMFTPEKDASPQDAQAALGRACKTLNSIARTKLQAYCDIEGSTRWWYMPNEKSPEDAPGD